VTAPGYSAPPSPSWWVKKNRVFFGPAGVVSWVGKISQLVKTVRSSPGSVTWTGGTSRLIKTPPITFIDANGSSGSSIATMPTHQSGDYLLMLAINPDSTVIPSLPAGWTSRIDEAINPAIRVGFKVAASSSETSGTWTTANGLLCVVYRNVNDIGTASASVAASSTNWVFPRLDLFDKNEQTSCVVMLGSKTSTDTSLPSTSPSGYTRRITFRAAFVDLGEYEAARVRTFGVESIAGGGSNDTLAFASIELRTASPNNTNVGFVSSDFSTSASFTEMPYHKSGDIIIIWAFNTGAATIPTLPAGWTSIITDSSTDSVRVGYKIAASGSETSGTWTAADHLMCAVYRNVSAIGDSAINNATSGTLSFPSLSLQQTNGTSTVLMFATTQAANGASQAFTDGVFPQRRFADLPTGDSWIFDAANQTSWSGDTVTSGGTSSRVKMASIELKN
jgi:hypothetical protein